MSETPQKILVRQWIRRAENDLLNVTFAVASRYPVETVEVADEPQGRRSLDIAQAIRRDCRAYLTELEPTLFDQSTAPPASRPSSSA